MKENIKGILATVVAVPTITVSWLQELELMLRIGASGIGIIAGLYAVRYWRQKWINAKSKAKPSSRKTSDYYDEESTTT